MGPSSIAAARIDDVYDARRVAEHLGIPYYVINFEREFEQSTSCDPSSTITCKAARRFRAPLQQSREVRSAPDHRAADRRASASPPAITRACATTPPPDATNCCAPLTKAKDQSYFLFGLKQEQLARTDFPLGELDQAGSARHRPRARRAGGGKAREPGNLFRAHWELREVHRRVSGRAGKFAAAGPGRYRHHLRRDSRAPQRAASVHGRPAARAWELQPAQPMYVVALDRAKNHLVVGEDRELRRSICQVRNINWIPYGCPRRRRWKPRSAFAIATSRRWLKSRPPVPPRRRSRSTSRSAPSLQAKLPFFIQETRFWAAVGSLQSKTPRRPSLS